LLLKAGRSVQADCCMLVHALHPTLGLRTWLSAILSDRRDASSATAAAAAAAASAGPPLLLLPATMHVLQRLVLSGLLTWLALKPIAVLGPRRLLGILDVHALHHNQTGKFSGLT
jgi:hypothetical protein